MKQPNNGDNGMHKVRCPVCGRFLCEVKHGDGVIKCPSCKAVVHFLVGENLTTTLEKMK